MKLFIPFSVHIRVGMYWYGYYGTDDFGSEYAISSSTLETFYAMSTHDF